VISEGPDQPIMRGEAGITDPASPFHPDRIGPRVAPYYHTATAMTQDQADAVALARLWQLVLFQDAVATDMVPDVTLDEGDVVAITETVTTRTDDRYWIESITYPLLIGSMALSGPRVAPVLAT
jgi:hypothetical protein